VEIVRTWRRHVEKTMVARISGLRTGWKKEVFEKAVEKMENPE